MSAVVRLRIICDVSGTDNQVPTPRISIVTPSFNQAQYLEATICSVLDQGYANLEYIVIDGGSTDGSAEILRRYDRHLAHWVSEKDRGQTHAINKGMARATGEIRAYLNSDDTYSAGTLHAVAEAALAHPEADLIYGDCAIMDGAGQATGAVLKGDIANLEDVLDVWGVWWQRRNYVQPEVFWTKRIADRVGSFEESLHYVMDYDYWVRIFAAGGRAHKIDRTLANFRLWEQQKSRNAEQSAAEMLVQLRGYLWDANVPIDRAKRRRLQGDWQYSTVFLPEVERLVAAGASRSSRMAGLALCVLRHPRLLAARGFKARLAAMKAGGGHAVPGGAT